MASKEDRVLGALESLKLVAQALHTPFDTSELEAAVKDLVGSAPKEVKAEVKAEGASAPKTFNTLEK